MSAMLIGTASSLPVYALEEESHTNDVHRLRNPYSGEHLFTAKKEESDALVNAGWIQEDTAWKSPEEGEAVHRLFNSWSNDHLYTMDEEEIQTLIDNGWVDEGIVFFSDEKKGTPVYRLYNRYASVGSHHYTASLQEYQELQMNGWEGEDIAWYGSAEKKSEEETDEKEEKKETITGWKTMNGKTSYFDENGKLVRNAWVDDRYVNANGEEETDILPPLTKGSSDLEVLEIQKEYTSVLMPFERDGMKIYGELYLPNNFQDSYPLTIISTGFNATADYTRNIAKDLVKKGRAAYVYEYIGGSVENCKSDGNFLDMSVLTEKEDLETVLRGLKKLNYIDGDHITLVGCSQGGLVSTLVSAEHSYEINGLVLYYPALDIPENARELYETEADIPKEPAAYNETVGKKYYEDAMKIDVEEAVSSYHGRVFIVHGSEDSVVSPEVSEKASKVFENADLVILPDLEHGFRNSDDSYTEDLAHADDLSAEFLNEVDPVINSL